MKGHVAFVAVAEISAYIRGPLVGFSQNHTVGVTLVHIATNLLDDSMRLGKVFAVCSVALDEVGNRIQAQAVDSEVQPEAHDFVYFLEHRRVVVVQIRLVRERSDASSTGRPRRPRTSWIFLCR